MPGFKIGIINFGSKISDSPRFYTSYTWDVTSISYLDSLSLGGGRLDNNAILLLKSATLPNITFKKIEIEGSVNYKFAGSPIFDDIRVSWYDSQGIGRYVKQWLELVINYENGSVKPSSKYKSSTVLTRYLVDRDAPSIANDDSEDERTDYVLRGSWPSAFKESDLTYVDSSIKTIELTLTYDFYIMHTRVGSGIKYSTPYSTNSLSIRELDDMESNG